MKNRKGFTIIEIVLVIVILATVGALGFIFLTKSNQKTTSTVPATVTDIKAASDIDTVTSQLNSINLDTDSSSELDSLTSQLNSF